MANEVAVPSSGRREGSARDTLLQAASNLMIEQGTADVSLHAIARAAGVTPPLVKYYFGSKDGLLIALVERDTARSLAQLEELGAMPLDPKTKLKIHIHGIARTYSRYPYLNGLLNEMLRGTEGEASHRIRHSFVEPLIKAQRAILEDGVREGQFRDVDFDKLYFLIVGACQYLFASQVAYRDIMGGKLDDADFVRNYATEVEQIVLRGISAG